MTRLAVLAVGVVMFGLLAALIWWLALRFERAGDRVVEPAFRWQVAERTADGRSVVVVERVEVGAGGATGAAQVVESRDVGAVDLEAADHAERLADLRTLGADRARLLNAQAGRA